MRSGTIPPAWCFTCAPRAIPGRISAALRQAVREADPNLPAVKIKTVEVRIRESLYTERLIAILSAAFGILATLLAAIGLYGVMAYSVTRRTGEIGVRMALGAVPVDVLRLILFGAVRLAAAGIVIGLAAALAAGRLIESQLFGIKAADPRDLCGRGRVARPGGVDRRRRAGLASRPHRPGGSPEIRVAYIGA